jgi:hypothetical protein
VTMRATNSSLSPNPALRTDVCTVMAFTPEL